MKVLMVEDDKYKSQAISKYLDSLPEHFDIDIEESLNSGLFKLEECHFDLIILDMSMPSFDISKSDPSGGAPESFAGKEFLSHMSLIGKTIPVIIVTQYDSFGPDEQQTSLNTLKKNLQIEYPQLYKASVYFSIKSDEWKRALLDALKGII
ncbi:MULTISPECIES: response regulator [Gammaproteobacteria]|uniref:response regulator n=1 Tax=Gammaproteobacteria TaxID=1236 RepID=UPI000DCF93B5|nr:MULTISPECIES: response regulator [Gammaproteobacteria]RTE86570.1 response regulator transcription factor [Aliidiomarina sp. B3213]TCZ90875.1 response regulator transcription factor [Lysobacter sp. N42]